MLYETKCTGRITRTQTDRQTIYIAYSPKMLKPNYMRKPSINRRICSYLCRRKSKTSPRFLKNTPYKVLPYLSPFYRNFNVTLCPLPMQLPLWVKVAGPRGRGSRNGLIEISTPHSTCRAYTHYGYKHILHRLGVVNFCPRQTDKTVDTVLVLNWPNTN